MNKEYKLLQSSNLDDIESQINEYAGQGWWELNGSMNTQVINGKPVYTQMLVREKNDINESPNNGKQLLHG